MLISDFSGFPSSFSGCVAAKEGSASSEGAAVPRSGSVAAAVGAFVSCAGSVAATVGAAVSTTATVSAGISVATGSSVSAAKATTGTFPSSSASASKKLIILFITFAFIVTTPVLRKHTTSFIYDSTIRRECNIFCKKPHLPRKKATKAALFGRLLNQWIFTGGLG